MREIDAREVDAREIGPEIREPLGLVQRICGGAGADEGERCAETEAPVSHGQILPRRLRRADAANAPTMMTITSEPATGPRAARSSQPPSM